MKMTVAKCPLGREAPSERIYKLSPAFDHNRESKTR